MNRVAKGNQMEKHIVKSLALGSAAGLAGGGITALGASLGLTPFAAIWPALAVCTVIGALVHNAKQSSTDLMDNRTHTLRKRLERVRRDVGDIHGLVRLGPYTQDLPLPIGGGWALTGDSAALLAREVLTRRPGTILELGSGVSTLILGQIVKKGGQGRVLSVDHDPGWASQTRRYVEFLGLDDVVTVVDAPLKALALGSQTFNWYDIPQSELDKLGAIDLLLVDGPPQSQDISQAARHPAFPVLQQRLSHNALVFVDDAHRSMESQMVRQWMAEDPGWSEQWFDTVDGVCLLTRKS
jgi:predicted O-methyltransferase YrrM